MKRILYCFFVTLLCVLCFSACGTDKPISTGSQTTSEQEEKNIQFVHNEISLAVGESVQAEVVTSKNNVFIFWSIRDTQVATVSNSGMITGLAVGETICYAEFAGEKVKCLVKVTAEQAKPMLSVSVPYEPEINLYVGDSLALKTTVKLGDSVIEDAQIEYEIDSAETVQVEDGEMSGLGVGSATVLIRATYEGQTASISLTVNVIEKQ